jgi:hypothetical protein
LLLVVGVLLVGAVLRFGALATLPIGLNVDEAINVLDQQTLSWSNHPIFFPAKGGREALFFYWQHLWVLGLGVSTFAVRMASTAVGLLTIAVEFAVFRRFFGKRVALFAVAVFATLFWAVIQSRVGLRPILLPLFTLLTLLALSEAARRRTMWSFAVAGAAVGVSLLTYAAARVLPLIATGYLLYLVITRARSWKTWLGGACVATISAIAVASPLIVHFVVHPDRLFARMGETLVIGSSSASGGTVDRLGHNAFMYAQALSVAGDVQWFINLPTRPIFDVFLAPFAYVGLMLLTMACFGVTPERWRGFGESVGSHKQSSGVDRDAAFLCLLSLPVLLLPGVLSTDAPYFPRITGVLPALTLAPALALDFVWLVARRFPWRPLAPLAVAVPLCIQAGLTARDYFGTWAHDPMHAYKNSNGVTAVATYLRDTPIKGDVLLSTYEQVVVQALAPEAYPRLRLFHARDVVLLSLDPTRDTTYFFVHDVMELDPSLIEQRLAAVATPVWSAKEPITGIGVAFGYRVPAGSSVHQLLPVGNAATFGRRLTVTGATISPNAEDPDQYDVVVGLRAARDAPGYLSLSVRAVDDAGAVWGQVDGLGDDATTWKAGQEALALLHLHLAGGTPPGALAVEARVYELVPVTNLSRDDSGGISLELGTIHNGHVVPVAKSSPYPASQDSDLVLNDLRVRGYSFDNASPRQADTVKLDLVWTCLRPAPSGTHLGVELVAADGAHLGDFEAKGLAAPSPERCTPGSTVVDRRVVRIGARWPAGAATARLKLLDGSGVVTTSATLAPLQIAPLARSSVAPPFGRVVNGAFADGVVLRGFTADLAPDDTRLDVDLVWQASAPPARDSTVFVHLLAPGGSVLAQHDGPPAQGVWPTTFWEGGQVIEDHHILTLPSRPPPGSFLEVGMYDPPTGKRLVVRTSGAAAVRDDALRIPLS